MTTYVCNKCGWAAFGVTKDFVEKSTTEFIEYYDALEEDKQKDYYGDKKVTKENLVERYSHCFNCGGSYLNFHQEMSDDKIPDGCTIQGIQILD